MIVIYSLVPTPLPDKNWEWPENEAMSVRHVHNLHTLIGVGLIPKLEGVWE